MRHIGHSTVPAMEYVVVHVDYYHYQDHGDLDGDGGVDGGDDDDDNIMCFFPP